ncbi:MAG: hypothetical protein WAM95_04935 [Bacillus sp. (in: firmicutes)]
MNSENTYVGFNGDYNRSYHGGSHHHGSFGSSAVGLLGGLTLGAIASQGVGYGGYPYLTTYPVPYSTQYPAPYPYSGYPY